MSAYKWFAKLEQLLAASGEFLDSDTLFRAYGFANAIYENIYDKIAPGAAGQSVKGHDHTGTRGGRAVARGTCYVAGTGDDTVMYCESTALGNVFIQADANVEASVNRFTNLNYHFRVYHSDRFASAGSSDPYTNGNCEGWIQLLWATNFTAASLELHAKITNVTMSRESETTVASVSGTTDGAFFKIEDIPFQAGWNNYSVQLKADMSSYGGGANQTNLSLTQFALMETPSVAQTTSTGTQQI